MSGPATEALDHRPAPETAADAVSGSAPSPRSRLRAIDWRPILLEAFFVVLGVVLALAANEWRQGVVERRAAVTALGSIREELESNRRLVLGSVQYHLRLVDTLGAIRRQSGRSADSPGLPDARVFAQGFVRPATLLSTAWETAAATDVVRHMAHDDVLTLARIYEQQRRYAAQGERVGDLIYAEIFARGPAGVIRNYANPSSIIGALAFRECELLVGYERTLAEIDATASRPGDVPEPCRRMTRR